MSIVLAKMRQCEEYSSRNISPIPHSLTLMADQYDVNTIFYDAKNKVSVRLTAQAVCNEIQKKIQDLLLVEKKTALSPKKQFSETQKVKYCQRTALPNTLTKDEVIIVENAMNADEKAVVAVVGNVVVEGGDARRFKKGKWLNDVCINAYLAHLQQCAAQDKSLFFRIHAFNTYFYVTLSDKGYEKVAPWTRKIDLFSFEKILVPIHLGAHWALAVINVAARRIEYYDSMCGGSDDVIERLRKYLIDECKNKKSSGVSPEEIDNWVVYAPKETPKQKNTTDCGVFVLEFARYSTTRSAEASDEPRFSFSQSDVPERRQSALLELIEASEKPRDRTQDVPYSQ